MIAATPAHAAALAAIHASGFSPAETWNSEAFAAQLALPGVFGLIDPAGAMLLARVAADEAEILTIAVAPELRRRGRGRALLDEAGRRAAASGAVKLFLEVAESNAAALALYTASGFRAVGRRRGYYLDGEDALLLARPLAPPESAPA